MRDGNRIFTATHEVYMLHIIWWRWKAEGKLKSYGVNPHPHFSLKHLAFILGFEGTVEMNLHSDKKTMTMIKQMCGPNGFAVYSILLARAIEREENKHAESEKVIG